MIPFCLGFYYKIKGQNSSTVIGHFDLNNVLRLRFTTAALAQAGP